MLDCNVVMLSVLTIKGAAVITREKGCMAMIVCERISDNIASYWSVLEELSLA